MLIEFLIKEELNADDLVKIFYKFADAYSFDTFENDRRYLQSLGIEDLLKDSRMEYRAGIGIKFFVTMKKMENQNFFWVQFQGYNNLENPKIEYEQTFLKSITSYLQETKKL
ncbi:MAG: hypothetical protein KJ583_02905 [Nanoarchaeota archaeon]|nr:hypothetical protein [Nanoarchaeota archaeon]MBU1270044.1 hypothetical protein [Nanoarchaeota archaeon]MBU1604244.1 hypothetical protein [Nanoarchaeota archaeon]MBU2443780.1 hypothetical protein [Nanoarchaeota archaeon]